MKASAAQVGTRASPDYKHHQRVNGPTAKVDFIGILSIVARHLMVSCCKQSRHLADIRRGERRIKRVPSLATGANRG